MGDIQVIGLGKAYRQYPTRWSRLFEWLMPWAGTRHQLRWVLKDVSFHVRPGEALGVIGINGAGKSTLLKMITGTTQPSAGQIHLGGRVAALLELGMGFHPEFTGRQNVFMAGQLLGMTLEELHELMPSIEAFAEIGEYIDHPVRTYSSGMQMRLAFSVATARRPDVLIVDEALSVGDAYFQHKSFERIRHFRAEGTTLLLVSHDRTAIQSICDRAILLNAGRLAREGNPEEVMDFYNALIADRENSTIAEKVLDDGRIQTTSGSRKASVIAIALRNARGDAVEVVEVGALVTLCIRFKVQAPIDRMVVGYAIKDRLGQTMYGTNTHYMEKPIHDLQSGDVAEVRFSFPVNLGPGSYSITTALTRDEHHLANNYEWRDLALVFSVANISGRTFVGCTWLEPSVEVLR